MSTFEVNFDGLVGPTHNYAGLAAGNVASARNAGQEANPREAALQGLRKMRALHRLGIPQGVIPPQPRPDLGLLRRLGFDGDDATVLRRAAEKAPRLLAAACSGSAMWAANAATVSPSADTADRRVHFTPANLVSSLHRSIEAGTTARLLRAIFSEPARFAHHEPLPGVPQLGDEGAANHTRLCADYGAPGVELFVYGRAAFGEAPAPVRHPARQTREAGEAVARLHGLDGSRTAFAQQNPAAIDAGVFHNDVIAVGNLDTLFYHEQAFLGPAAVREAIRRAAPFEPRFLEVPAARVSLADAVDTYLFNSQLISPPGGGMTLVVPVECREHAGVWGYLESLAAGGDPVTRIEVLDVRQSMRNGGGPACLRLRVTLTDAEWGAVAPGARFDEALYGRLTAWVERHYRDRLAPEDLADPALVMECRTALDELTGLLGLGAVYDFQHC